MAGSQDDIRARLLATFRTEAEEHLQVITAHLLALEEGNAGGEGHERLEAVFRAAHTLKGAARSVSMSAVESLCQAMESVLSRIKRGDLAWHAGIVGSLHAAVDGVAHLLDSDPDSVNVTSLIAGIERAANAMDAPQAGPVAPSSTPTPLAGGLTGSETVRLATQRLDALLLQAEDLLVLKLTADERVAQARALADAVGRRSPEAPNFSPAPAAMPLDLRPQTRALLQHLSRDARTVAVTVDRMLDELRRLRMMPAATMLEAFPRMVRDLAAEQRKQVRWVVEGSELELDRKVLEVVKEPLLHLVRNAIDHGIEAAEARVRAGKPPGGSVCVRFTALERNCVEVEVSDDGRGIEPEKVRGAAVRARLLSQDEARALSEDVVLQLVYRSGLSTSPIVTQISGHGLGLAIVKEAVERVGGHVQLQSRAGTGTTVRLTLPAAVATFRGLLVSAGGQSFLLPLENVERAVRVAECDLESIEGRPSMRWNGSALLAAPLAAVLDLAELTGGERSNDVRPGVVLRHGDERAVLLVDDITGHREVLVKALGAPLMRVRNVAAAGLVGTGEVVLILRPADLLATIRAGVRRPAPSPVAKPPAAPPVVLVVDDSITTRTMEKNLLESAGYRVRVAVDGLEAMTLLKTEPVDLVLSDIDMPRMDGFELTARIRTDRQLADLPVVLVTALESREDKERGIEVGANAYVVKSSFDQSNLLGILQRLV